MSFYKYNVYTYFVTLLLTNKITLNGESLTIITYYSEIFPNCLAHFQKQKSAYKIKTKTN